MHGRVVEEACEVMEGFFHFDAVLDRDLHVDALKLRRQSFSAQFLPASPPSRTVSPQELSGGQPCFDLEDAFVEFLSPSKGEAACDTE
jgi:hypothetical protein